MDNNNKKSFVGKWRAKFVELYSRIIKINENKDESIYYNGENNLYPNEIELAILNSPSGKQASKIMANYISGKGVVEDVIVNEDKKYKTSNIVKIAASDISRQNGVYFHVGQSISENLTLKPVIDILEYTKTRIGKEDDNDYVSKYWFKDYCIEKSFNKKESPAEWYYAFNNNPDVILAQIKSDYECATESKEEADLSDMLPYYRGQVYYMNLTPEFKYALSPFDAVYNDLDSESRISMYTNRQVRTGFLGKTYLVTSGLDDEDIEQVEADAKSWLGAEQVGGVFTLHVEKTEDIDKVFKVGQVKAEIDEKLFTETKSTIKQNIFGAANNIPDQLVKSSDTLFGTNAGTYVEMKKFYTEQTEIERKAIEDTIVMLGYPCKIIPIIDISEQEIVQVGEKTAEQKNADAQAELRGSVGGVTSLLGIQTSYANGTTSYESAIAMINLIFGFTEEEARKLLGNPEKIDPNESPTTTV